MGKLLSNKDYCDSAEALKCKVAALKAVADVESSGSGYLKDGKIKIRFEGHKFREFTGKKYDKTNPDVSYPYSVQKSKTHGYPAFNKAFALDPTAAMLATSWGKFQPMGFTHQEAGFSTVDKFVDFLRESEANQLEVFVRMVKRRGLVTALRKGTLEGFAQFAEKYNGADYKSNDYHHKMLNRFEKFEKQNIDCNDAHKEDVEVEDKPAVVTPAEDEGNDTSNSNGDVTQNVDVNNNENVIVAPSDPAPQKEPITLKAFTISLWTKLVGAVLAITGMGINAGELIQAKLENLTLSQIGMFALGTALVVLAAFYIKTRQEAADDHNKLMVMMAADTTKNTVQLHR